MQGTVTKRYVIMKHGRPVGVFTPWEMQKTELKKKGTQKPWGILEELKKLQFKSDDPHLSEHIDEIAYGIGRNTYPD